MYVLLNIEVFRQETYKSIKICIFLFQMKNTVKKLSFTCTDRLGETQSVELEINAEKYEENDQKIEEKEKILAQGKVIIDKLNDFQNKINTLMTVFVEKEKDAISSKLLSNEHLKKENLNVGNISIKKK